MASPITASAFNRLEQYASCPVNRVNCYAELAVSSLMVAENFVVVVLLIIIIIVIIYSCYDCEWDFS